MPVGDQAIAKVRAQEASSAADQDGLLSTHYKIPEAKAVKDAITSSDDSGASRPSILFVRCRPWRSSIQATALRVNCTPETNSKTTVPTAKNVGTRQPAQRKEP